MNLQEKAQKSTWEEAVLPACVAEKAKEKAKGFTKYFDFCRAGLSRWRWGGGRRVGWREPTFPSILLRSLLSDGISTRHFCNDLGKRSF